MLCKKADGSDEPEMQVPNGMVAVRVTKHGDGKVSTGVHMAPDGDEPGGDVMAKRDDVLFVDPATAASMEAKGYGEIE